jgi:hypothetical protein
MLERLVLTATVMPDEDGYLATLDSLELRGSGDSVRRAQDELVDMVRSWIESRQSDETLEQALAEAGFPGLEEDTEIHLEFQEVLPEPQDERLEGAPEGTAG